MSHERRGFWNQENEAGVGLTFRLDRDAMAWLEELRPNERERDQGSFDSTFPSLIAENVALRMTL